MTENEKLTERVAAVEQRVTDLVRVVEVLRASLAVALSRLAVLDPKATGEQVAWLTDEADRLQSALAPQLSPFDS